MPKEKLTICFFGNARSVHMIKWAKFFAGKKHIVHLISYDYPRKEEDIKGINLHILKKIVPITIWPFNTLFNLPFNIIRVRRLIKKIKPDIINAHYVTSYGHLATFTSFHPLVITAWGSDILITPKEYFLARMVVKYVLKKADVITCDAEHMKEEMIKLGADPKKIKIINFGVDTKKFTPPESKELLKSKTEFKNSIVVISLRSLEPVYNIETLISAVPIVAKKVPEIKFVIAGEGSEEKKLKELAKRLNVSEKVKFVGNLSQNEVAKYLAISDIYVSTSLSDAGIASSTAEAMASGLSVIVTESGANKDWIKQGENGFLIPVRNVNSLAEKIIFLAQNNAIREKLGKNARKTILERNDYYNEMEKMERIYKNLLIKT